MKFKELIKQFSSDVIIFKEKSAKEKPYFLIGEAKGKSLGAVCKRLRKEGINFSLLELSELSRKDLRNGSYRYYVNK